MTSTTNHAQARDLKMQTQLGAPAEIRITPRGNKFMVTVVWSPRHHSYRLARDWRSYLMLRQWLKVKRVME